MTKGNPRRKHRNTFAAGYRKEHHKTGKQLRAISPSMEKRYNKTYNADKTYAEIHGGKPKKSHLRRRHHTVR